MAGHVAKLEIRILGEIREFLIENTQTSFEEQMREVKKFVTQKIAKALDSTEELLSVEGTVQSLVTMQTTELSKWNCDLIECRKRQSALNLSSAEAAPMFANAYINLGSFFVANAINRLHENRPNTTDKLQ